MKLTKLAMRVGFLVLVLSGGANAAPHTAADAAAVGTVETYLAALMAGDVPGMQGNLGDVLASERAPLLANPGYPDTLQKAYAGAEFRITGSQQVAAGRARVDALLLLPDDQTVSVQFELEAHDHTWRIVAEH